MGKKFKRKIFNVSNHFQRHFLYPVVIAFLIGCVVSWLSLVYFYVVNIPTSYLKFEQFKQIIPLFLVLFSFLMFCVMLWTCYAANKVFGPYQRILRELDEITCKKRLGPLVVRTGDEMFAELLKRINNLIERKS